jgi:LAS superfamily LD-carboxypeptidase LdcB
MSQIPNLNLLSNNTNTSQEETSRRLSVLNRSSGQPTGVYEPLTTNGGELITRALTVYNKRGQETGVLTEWKKYGVTASGEDIIIPIEIAIYLDSMFKHAASDGVILQLNSGFRTMQYQTNLVKKHELVSKPGTSLHQRGYAIDLNTGGAKEYEWLVRNAYRFGFIRTVPSERWHWEYRGTWPGQTRPKWAAPPASSMFEFVPANHTCGGEAGGRFPLKSSRWYTLPNGTHPDQQTNGYTNTWVGPDGSYLPEKFDVDFPGWDAVR